MLDAQWGLFSNAQALHSTTVASTNVLDMLIARDIGVGNTQEINIYVTEAAVSAGGATLQCVLQTSPTAGGGGTFYDVLLSPVMAVADLTLGSHIFQVPLPRLWQPNEKSHGMPQYLRMNYVIGTSTFSALAVTAYLASDLDRQAYFTYPRNYSAPH